VAGDLTTTSGGYELRVPEPEGGGVLRMITYFSEKAPSLEGARMIRYTRYGPEMGIYKVGPVVTSTDSTLFTPIFTDRWPAGYCMLYGV